VNKLTKLGPISKLSNVKSLRLCENRLGPGSLEGLAHLPKLQSFAADGNLLGKSIKTSDDKKPKTVTTKSPEESIPKLPPTLKQLMLSGNHYHSIPPEVLGPHLTQIVSLDMSNNNIAAIPSSISNLQALRALYLNKNMLVSLPEEIGKLSKLKTLSIKDNKIFSTGKDKYDPVTDPQPLPASLFKNTELVDLNLHGNPMTYTSLSSFEGFDTFLERRKGVKTKGLTGGAMTDMDVCGLA